MSVSLPPEAHAGLARYNQQVQEELSKQHRQQLAEHCFKKCIASKGSALSGDRLDRSEQTCIAMCRDRYQDTLKAVEQALRDRQSRGS